MLKDRRLQCGLECHAVVNLEVRMGRISAGRMRRLIHEGILIENRCLDALEDGHEALNTRPWLSLPGVEQRETDLAVFVKIRIETCLPVIGEIVEDRGLKRIVVWKPYIKAEGSAVIRSVVVGADNRPSVIYLGFVVDPEEPGVRKLHYSLNINRDASNC